jgi:hypothetical protein
MVRKIELAAGIATGILGLGALALLLFAPLVPYCPHMSDTPCAQVRYTSLLHTGLDGPGWVYLLCMTLLLLAGSLSAVAEARTPAPFIGGFGGGAIAAIPLWASAILAFAGCALAARGAGLVYMPSVLVLCLAAYASLLRRLALWRAAPASTAGTTALAVDPEVAAPATGAADP